MKPVPALDPEGLPEYRRWRSDWGNPTLTLWDYARQSTHLDIAAAYATLFWPEFVEVDGCVLLEENYLRTSYAEWREKLGGERRSIEQMINHVHVYDLFDPPEDHGVGAPEGYDYLPVDEFLAGVLMKCWSRALEDRFPGRTFVFDYATEPDDYGPTFTFFQEHGPAEDTTGPEVTPRVGLPDPKDLYEAADRTRRRWWWPFGGG